MNTERIELEDALKHLQACEARERGATVESVAGSLQIRRERAARVLGRLLEAGLARHERRSYHLTEDGRAYALQLVRAHRLYETFLARRTGVPETEWHREAHAAEHRMSRAEVDSLAQQLGYPRYDPHGDPIPQRDGRMTQLDAVNLLDLPAGWEGRLAHIEDEPEEVYRRLVAAGFAAGMRIKLLDLGAHGVDLNLEGQVLRLSLEDAANLECGEASLENELENERPIRRLSSIAPGEKVEIEGLSPACRGAERRRLLDLGVVPGSLVEVSFAGPFSSPRAYRVRGSLIGLRKEQADHIIVRAAEVPRSA